MTFSVLLKKGSFWKAYSLVWNCSFQYFFFSINKYTRTLPYLSTCAIILSNHQLNSKLYLTLGLVFNLTQDGK